MKKCAGGPVGQSELWCAHYVLHCFAMKHNGLCFSTPNGGDVVPEVEYLEVCSGWCGVWVSRTRYG